MNKISYFLITVFAMLSLSSCTKEQEVVPEMDFDLQIFDTNDESVLACIRPSDMSRTYYYSAISLDEYSKLGDDEALAASVRSSLDNPEIQNKITSGYIEEYETGLQPETEYYLYALALSKDGKDVGKVTKVQFTTAKALESFNCAIEVIESSIVSVRSKFVPADAEEKYYVGVVEKSVYDKAGGGVKAIQADLEEIIEKKMKEYPYYSRKSVVEMMLLAGEKTAKNIALNDNTDYYIWASAVDANGIIIKKPAIISFTTPEYIPVDASVTADIPKYYDGDDAVEVSGEYSYAQGYVITPIIIETEGSVKDYYLTFLGEDYESTEKYSDTDIISILLKQGVMNVKSGSLYFLNWVPTTVCMVAVDKDGNFGPVFRKKYTFDKNGVSPISDIIR